MNEIVLRILNCIKKRWYIILICAVLCSGGLVVEKTYFSPVLPQTDTMHFMKIVKFADEAKVYSERNDLKVVTIIPVIHMWGNEDKFLKLSQNEFDYEKFCKGWNKKKTAEKLQWLNQHVTTNYMGAGIYEFVFAFSAHDAKDSDYIIENGERYLAAYVEYAKDVSSIIIDSSNAQEIDKFSLYEPKNNVNKTDIIIKYAIIGAFLGILVGIVLVASFPLKKE